MQAKVVLAAGGEVWFGDETTLREFPPLRVCWAKRGKQREVVISTRNWRNGRSGRRVTHGALCAGTGELVRLVRERSRQADCIAFLQALAHVRPDVPRLLIWDHTTPHPKRVLAAAAAAHVTIAWLPFRSPELNPLEDLWRLHKALVAPNRVYVHARRPRHPRPHVARCLPPGFAAHSLRLALLQV